MWKEKRSTRSESLYLAGFVTCLRRAPFILQLGWGAKLAHSWKKNGNSAFIYNNTIAALHTRTSRTIHEHIHICTSMYVCRSVRNRSAEVQVWWNEGTRDLHVFKLAQPVFKRLFMTNLREIAFTCQRRGYCLNFEESHKAEHTRIRGVNYIISYWRTNAYCIEVNVRI